MEIFDFYLDEWGVEEWQSLVHVCRRWRSLVLGSPRRLNLQIYCSPNKRVRDMLDVWPAFPLIVGGTVYLSGMDNVIAALEQSNRVRKVELLYLSGWQAEPVLATMQVPFPELTDLHLSSNGEILSVIPDSFLGGSAPRLQTFRLFGLPFPGLPKLLLTATHLVTLSVSYIPHSGYISPEAIAALISTLSNLEELTLDFQSPQSRPDRESSPSKRSVIPALISLHFKGVVEYLENLVTHIDTPQLERLDIAFFNQVDFHTPRLAQFFDRTPKLAKHYAFTQFDDNIARVGLSSRTETTLEIAILCKVPDWQLSSIEQVCNYSSPLLSKVEDLFIDHEYRQRARAWSDGIVENTLWLQLLRPFTAVKNLYLCELLAPGIAVALQQLVEGRITEVLPSLQTISVERFEPSGSFEEIIGQFITARQLSDRPITISYWGNSTDDVARK